MSLHAAIRRPQPAAPTPAEATWTEARRDALVGRVLSLQLPQAEVEREHGLAPGTVAEWTRGFVERAQQALARPRPPKVCQDVSEAVGHTPLVRLQRAIPGFEGEAYAKLEFMNPMGSVKDRVARHLVQRAARDGRLRPGDTLVEASSGNTALGLGMMAVLGGYGCKVVIRDRTAAEKLKALQALGVELELVPSDLPPDHPQSYNRAVDRVLRETDDAYFPDQHNNRENNEAHYLTTGPEIWDQMEGKIDAFVAGVGTGGTISGVARYLKERDPSIRVIGVDPEGSVFSTYFRTGRLPEPGPYLLEGLGDEELIACVEWDLIDDMLQVHSRQAFQAARELARLEGIFAGGSSGAALWATRQVARRFGPTARIVTLFPDNGHRYLTTFYDAQWCAQHLPPEGSPT